MTVTVYCIVFKYLYGPVIHSLPMSVATTDIGRLPEYQVTDQQRRNVLKDMLEEGTVRWWECPDTIKVGQLKI